MTPARYLAGIVEARVLYRWLYEDAVAMLPPPVDGVALDLASHRTLRDAAESLGWPYATVRRCIAQLVTWGWVRDRAMPRYLGRRDGPMAHLLGDLAAEQHTGQRDVVSRIVLGLNAAPVVEQVQGPAPNPTPGPERGTRRKWEGMDGTWGTGAGKGRAR